VTESATAQSATVDALYDALALRDGSPPCETLAALTDDPLGDFLWLVDHAKQPPWVGMRAARCVILDHADAAQDTLLSWVAMETRGLHVQLLGHLDDLPEPIAVAIAEATLAEGAPDPERDLERVAKCSHPAVRALLSPQ
jgi:alkanesulfonate monooxygenase SsuD/methylene tetrahydromethanopterin reductase-like flavin-dependent oxidoreductase (luciferase family)